MTTSDLPGFPFDTPPEFDGEPEYARLRVADPVPKVRLPAGGEAYLATRYADVKRVFADPVFSRAEASKPGAQVLRPNHRGSPHLLVSMDPPEHSRVRKLVMRALTVRAVDRMRPRVQQTVDSLIDRMVEQGPPSDFVKAFATPLPASVISDLLGAPASDHEQLMSWLDAILSVSGRTPEEVTAASENMFGYIKQLIASKRTHPADDLLTALIQAHDEGDRLSEPEVLFTTYILISGGYETTASLLADSIITLHRHPDQLALLQSKPELIPQATEELLRYVRIVRAAMDRVTTEEVELGERVLPAGSTVIPVQYSANRDPSLTPDPDRLDVTRAPTQHMTFGYGIHHCVGASLARLELQTAFATLLRRLPDLRLAQPEDEVIWKAGLLTRAPATLMVTWSQ